VTPAELITGIITERGVFKPGELADEFRRNVTQPT
jgi:methylthioribose-1-phosphate isomerase